MDETRKPVMITWQVHRRTTEMCRALGIPVFELLSRRAAPVRHLSLAIRTIRTVIETAPDRLIVQNPSLVLASLAVLMRPLLRFRVVVDAHNEAVAPVVHDSALVRAVSRWVVRRADLTIVTNRRLAESVRKIGGAPAILPDAIPDIGHVSKRESGSECKTAAVISTAAPDEPLDIVIRAAEALPEMNFRVTGSQKKFEARYGTNIPENMTLTGFLADDEYWSLLGQATMIIDLTTMPDCLVCGAYEAIAVGTPLILSRNYATEEVFGDCGVLVANDVASLISAVTKIAEDPVAHRIVVAEFRARYQKKWQSDASSLLNQIDSL